jgi:hypothetical protein
LPAAHPNLYRRRHRLRNRLIKRTLHSTPSSTITNNSSHHHSSLPRNLMTMRVVVTEVPSTVPRHLQHKPRSRQSSTTKDPAAAAPCHHLRCSQAVRLTMPDRLCRAGWGMAWAWDKIPRRTGPVHLSTRPTYLQVRLHRPSMMDQVPREIIIELRPTSVRERGTMIRK